MTKIIDQDKVMMSPEDLSDYLLLSNWVDRVSLSSDQRNDQQYHLPPQPQQTMRYAENDLKIKISRFDLLIV